MKNTFPQHGTPFWSFLNAFISLCTSTVPLLVRPKPTVSICFDPDNSRFLVCLKVVYIYICDCVCVCIIILVRLSESWREKEQKLQLLSSRYHNDTTNAMLCTYIRVYALMKGTCAFRPFLRLVLSAGWGWALTDHSSVDTRFRLGIDIPCTEGNCLTCLCTCSFLIQQNVFQTSKTATCKCV